MEFSLTEEQQLFRQTVRRFALEKLLPNYSRWDRGSASISPPSNSESGCITHEPSEALPCSTLPFHRQEPSRNENRDDEGYQPLCPSDAQFFTL